MMFKGFPRITNEYVVVALHATKIVCMWVQKSRHTNGHIRAARMYTCNYHEIGSGIIFNPTWVCAQITSFLNMYNLGNAFIVLMPDMQSVKHGFVACSSAHPQDAEFAPYRTRYTLYSYHYLYPTDEDRFVFYWYRIAHTLLMQYACMSIRGSLNCIRITPRFSALIAAYRMMHGTAFRASQLASDMAKVGNHISHYFTKDAIRRCIQGSSLCDDDFETMLDGLAACALLYNEKEWE